MPERKRRPAAKRTTAKRTTAKRTPAKRTPAKKAAAKKPPVKKAPPTKPAVPVEEPEAVDVVASEDERTPPAGQGSPDKPVEASEAAEAGARSGTGDPDQVGAEVSGDQAASDGPAPDGPAPDGPAPDEPAPDEPVAEATAADDGAVAEAVADDAGAEPEVPVAEATADAPADGSAAPEDATAANDEPVEPAVQAEDPTDDQADDQAGDRPDDAEPAGTPVEAAESVRSEEHEAADPGEPAEPEPPATGDSDQGAVTPAPEVAEDTEDAEDTADAEDADAEKRPEQAAATGHEPATDAADEAEEEPAPLVGRARLFDALTHFRRGQVAVAVLLCVLGYAAVVQVQTNTEDSTYAGLREQELIDILSGLAGTTQKAQEQIDELEATRDELEDQTLQQQTALQRAEEQVDTLQVIAGTVPVSGPGITIEIDPGADPLRLTALLDLIEELRTSGAEAIEIEGADGEAVRLVASTSIEVSQTAPGLNVGGELISPPYRLQVIGPPDTLAGAIDFYQGPQDQLEEQGAEVSVESEEKIDIESIHTVSR